ncbi:coiled-coil domain-containing protein 130 homolog [Sitophilus oryzae]|uniref:Coiled-coil domain-containing protein 130 homolog n=1 Tax=Sitophilus oryzae TaxID=7048 RepID=A0A6J2XYB0_SITOR|nr:coiled-coil domain-containing protein 130 homolog [Sitophilus oryzae]
MGERKGTNKYYPPDYDPKVGGLNKFLGTHALRERARKIDKGIIIIRFEMPYNIWCDECKNHIGMGVRYNAEKTKVGMYYTTPVYEFKMKCHLCDNHFVIRADPANLDYIIISGARRQENRWDPTQNGQVVPETKEVQKRLFDDKMYKLEHGTEDKNTMESAKPRLVKLFNRNEDNWSDNYTANQKLRAQFRKQNYESKIREKKWDANLRKIGLDIPLLEERDEDKHTASLLAMRPIKSSEENLSNKRKEIISQSSLPTTNFSKKKEENAVKLLKGPKLDLGIIKKKNTVLATSDNIPEQCGKQGNEINSNLESDICDHEENDYPENVKRKKGNEEILQSSLVGDYGSTSSESE